jgi:hypothetical protein
VRTTTLDGILQNQEQIGFCKLDVEGHELKVLEGAEKLLKERRLRDVVFEDFGPYPGPVQKRLLEHGYTIFALNTRLTRPVLNANWQNSHFNGDKEGADFLATLNPGRAQERYEAAGWKALRSS